MSVKLCSCLWFDRKEAGAEISASNRRALYLCSRWTGIGVAGAKRVTLYVESICILFLTVKDGALPLREQSFGRCRMMSLSKYSIGPVLRHQVWMMLVGATSALIARLCSVRQKENLLTLMQRRSYDYQIGMANALAEIQDAHRSQESSSGHRELTRIKTSSGTRQGSYQ